MDQSKLNPSTALFLEYMEHKAGMAEWQTEVSCWTFMEYCMSCKDIYVDDCGPAIDTVIYKTNVRHSRA